MRDTGLTHLTAVSGSNITIVCGAGLLVAAWCGLRRRSRVVAAAAVLVAFVVVAGPEPSVLRAGVMGAVGLLGLVGSRRGTGMPALCLAVVVLAVVDPWLARAFGFALSVLATSGLLLLARPLAQAMSRAVPTWLALAVAVPLAAQTVCGPVTILLSPQVPLTAVPANLLVAPAVAPATVLGVVATVLAPVWPSGAASVAWLARLGGAVGRTRRPDSGGRARRQPRLARRRCRCGASRSGQRAGAGRDSGRSPWRSASFVRRPRLVGRLACATALVLLVALTPAGCGRAAPGLVAARRLAGGGLRRRARARRSSCPPDLAGPSSWTSDPTRPRSTAASTGSASTASRCSC